MIPYMQLLCMIVTVLYANCYTFTLITCSAMKMLGKAQSE